MFCTCSLTSAVPCCSWGDDFAPWVWCVCMVFHSVYMSLSVVEEMISHPGCGVCVYGISFCVHVFICSWWDDFSPVRDSLRQLLLRRRPTYYAQQGRLRLQRGRRLTTRPTTSPSNAPSPIATASICAPTSAVTSWQHPWKQPFWRFSNAPSNQLKATALYLQTRPCECMSENCAALFSWISRCPGARCHTKKKHVCGVLTPW